MLFPTLTVREENKRIICDKTQVILVPHYVAEMIRGFVEDKQKIAAIKIIRLLYPGIGLREAKIAVEVLWGVIGSGENPYSGIKVYRYPINDAGNLEINIVEEGCVTRE
jgi:hypothetical protein